MPTKTIFRCQFCSAQPDPLTQLSLEHTLQEFVSGEYMDALPGRWLIWHGRGPFGPNRYACPLHRGDLTADMREHYGSVGPQVWKMPPYATTRHSPDAERARALRPSGPSWGLRS